MTKESKLLKAAKDGNAAAFEQIVKKYQSLVCAITFSGTGRVDISEELAQETFLSAWKNLRQLTEPSGFRPWLCTIARNMLNNYYRQKKPVPLDPANIADMSNQTQTPPEILITQEEQIMLEQTIMQMPPDYREPLVLFYRQQQSIPQVAKALGLNEPTVRTRLYRARQMLREEIAVRLEHTLERTAPGKTFTKAVMVAIGGAAIGLSAGSVNAAAANAAATATSGGITAVMSTVTAKVITAAAVVAIVAGGVIIYNHFKQPSHEPKTEMLANTKGEEPDETREQALEPSIGKTDNFVPLSLTTKNPDTKESDGLTKEITQKPKKNNPTISETNSIQIDSNDSLIVGGFVKSQDGQPISGVDVELLWDIKRDMPMLDMKRAVTNDNGKWQCQISGESEDITIRLKHPDYLSLFSDYRPSLDELIEGTAVLIMQKGLQVSGIVHDIQGNPVPNALIMPPNSITGVSAAYGIQDSAKTTRTDTNGLFLLKAVELGLQDIAVDANGYAPAFVEVNITQEMSPLDITLDHGKNLTGFVVDINGEPLSEVNIKIDEWEILRGTETNYSHKNFHMLRRQATTDSLGQYTIKYLPSIGDVDMIFVKRPHFLVSSIKNKMAQNKTKPVTMYPIPTITGTVIDADSAKPINEFEVVAGCTWDPNSVGIWNLNIDKITSPQGNFSITKSNFTAHENPSPGWVAAKISAKGYHSTQSPWFPIGQELSPVTICLKKAQILSSTLYYSNGVAASNTNVILIEPSSWVFVKNGEVEAGISNSVYSTIQTDINGYFEFSEPSSPTKILVLDYDGYLVADTNNLSGKLILTPWAYVTGFVQSDTNSNVTVQIAPEYNPNEKIRWMSEQTTNVDGRFEFFYIPAISQKTYYGPPDSTNSLNKGPDINPLPNEELEIRLGAIQSVDLI